MSSIFFCVWLLWLYLFRNPTHSLAPIPISIKQAIKDFYTEGIIACLVVDIVAIQMTKLCIKSGTRYGFQTKRFYFWFLANIAISYFLFSVAVFFFQVEDMVRLYTEFVPNDPLPIIPYDPLGYLSSSVNLFYPTTLIHVTSKGLISTYFMPQSVILYCAVATQLTLVLMASTTLLIGFLIKIKRLMLSVIRSVGTPEGNADSVIALMIWALFCIPLFALCIYWIADRATQ